MRRNEFEIFRPREQEALGGRATKDPGTRNPIRYVLLPIYVPFFLHRQSQPTSDHPHLHPGAHRVGLFPIVIFLAVFLQFHFAF